MFKKGWVFPVLAVVAGMFVPAMVYAQDVPATGLSTDIKGLQSTLEQVYNTMLGKSGELIGIGQALAGFGALLYISYRVWGSLARAQEIDVFPLLRPFAIGLVLAVYPGFIGVLNGLLQPTVAGTAALVDDSNAALGVMLQQREAAIEQSADWQMYVGPDGGGSEEKWEQYSGDASTGFLSGVANAVKFQMAKIAYNVRNGVKVVLAQILEIVYESAALCINTLRTFNLLLLAILGPLVLGLCTFDGFTNVLTAWLGRYIHVFLWLPVANIFGSLCAQVQVEMINLELQNGIGTFGPTDTTYMIFLLIATVGYFSIPSITGHILQVFPSGGGALSGGMARIGRAVAKGASGI